MKFHPVHLVANLSLLAFFVTAQAQSANRQLSQGPAPQTQNSHPSADDAGERVAFARVLQRENKWDEANSEFTEAIRLANGANGQGAYAAEYGRFLSDWGKYPESEAQYRLALRYYPTRGYLHAYLGDTLGKQSKWKGAEAEYREAIRSSSVEEGANHSHLAVALIKQNKKTEAEPEIKTAENILKTRIQAHPETAYYHRDLALCLQLENKLLEAEAELREAVRLDPTNAEYQADLQELLRTRTN